MRRGGRIALAAVIAGAGMLLPTAAHAVVPQQAAGSAAAAGWTEVGWYDYYEDCDLAGLRGQNKRWWVTYRCMVMIPSKPGKPGVYPLDVKYN